MYLKASVPIHTEVLRRSLRDEILYAMWMSHPIGCLWILRGLKCSCEWAPWLLKRTFVTDLLLKELVSTKELVWGDVPHEDSDSGILQAKSYSAG